ncbi:efflux transporter outer membrane subunit [Paraburkholderia sp.]|uniref:efflux transporter outer membrane subunit n=1 Tax=Paraburkholderia sp. TaxID=1926495 RepID=UPI0023906210|nr:efflux transporter outer membrane subunit [Paraburkholderia sp.]MDE1181106.1 efflux transporter outer membrane subunit [Paraburkholderia sp.]
MKLRLVTAAIAAVVLTTACSMDPVYQRPASPVPDSFAGGGAVRTVAAKPDDAANQAVLSDWKAFFKDPYLQQLVTLTLQNNRDLRQAALKVAEYEAQYRIARSNLAPTITATGTNTKAHSSGVTSQSSSVQLGMSSWEVDFFGRLRSLKNQALEEYLSTDAARLSTQLSLVSTTATDYLTWLSDRSLLNIAQHTVQSDQETYETTLKSAQLGSGAEEDVQEARTSLASAKASVASYQRAVEQDRNNLVAAIGCALPEGFPQDRELQDDMLFADVPVGLSSDLLTRRPDIVEAEHTLKSSNAYVGAARAAFFPTISLTAAAGTASSALTGLFKAGSGSWSFAPSISVPIFNYGDLKASLDVAKITKNIDIAAYEEAIQTAFKEVSNGLAGRTTYVDQVEADREYVDAAQKYYDIANARYRAGLDGFLTLLTAQRTLFTAQSQLVTDRLGQQSNLITLYTALGGGWTQQEQTQASAK